MPFCPKRFRQTPIVGILRGVTAAQLEGLLPAVQAGGLTTLEITMNTPDADALIAHAVALAHGALAIGAGTVCDRADYDRAVAAGASFIVTPITAPEVLRAAREDGVPIFPGAFTPTEIHTAWTGGATMVKLFPADALGPAYIKAVKAPLNGVEIMAVGGVTVASLPDFRRAGAAAVGVGSPLFPRDRLAAGDWAFIQAECARYVAAWHALDAASA